MFHCSCSGLYITHSISHRAKIYASFAAFFLPSFQLLICRAIKIPITTRIISLIAYFKYFPVLFSISKFCLIFLKNFIIFCAHCFFKTRHCEEARRGNLLTLPRFQFSACIISIRNKSVLFELMAHSRDCFMVLPFSLRVASRGKMAVLPFGAASCLLAMTYLFF